MKNTLNVSVALFSLFLGFFLNSGESNSSNSTTSSSIEKQVEAAILDYVEGIYEVAPERIEKSVSPELRKRGYWYNEEKKEYVDNLDMSYQQLVDLAGTWNEDGSRANDDSIKEIQIYEVNDRTASAKLTAVWGVDYFHLAKMGEKWQIVNVLWQSLP